MPRAIPPSLSLSLTFLREVRGWTQQELAEAAGVGRGTTYEYEAGSRRRLKREMLEEYAALMGCGPLDVSLTLLFVQGLTPA